MQKWIGLLLLAAMLTGCGVEPTMETVADEWVEPALAPPREIQVELPDEAAVPAVEGDSGRVYLCQDYEIVIQTLPGGDVDSTIRTLSGYDRQRLTVMQTTQQDAQRFDFVWSCAGEDGEQLGRGVILDDGTYHYTMSVLRSAADTEKTQIVWRSVFESFRLT